MRRGAFSCFTCAQLLALLSSSWWWEDNVAQGKISAFSIIIYVVISNKGLFMPGMYYLYYQS